MRCNSDVKVPGHLEEEKGVRGWGKEEEEKGKKGKEEEEEDIAL